MQKGLGIAALVIAILAMFVPFLGTWLTVLAGLLAAFAFGSGIGLGVASIVINVVHILFFSPLLWATQGLAEIGAAQSGDRIVFLPWLLISAQLGAGTLLFFLHRKSVSSDMGGGTFEKTLAAGFEQARHKAGELQNLAMQSAQERARRVAMVDPHQVLPNQSLTMGTARCPSCNAAITPEHVFCGECGHRLA